MNDLLSCRVVDPLYHTIENGRMVFSFRVLPVGRDGRATGDERVVKVGKIAAWTLMDALHRGEIVTLDGAEWEEA